MVSDTGLTQEPPPERDACPVGKRGQRTRRKARARSQAKFSRPVRLMLWLGLPVVLWSGIYALWRGLS